MIIERRRLARAGVAEILRWVAGRHAGGDHAHRGRDPSYGSTPDLDWLESEVSTVS